MAPEWGWAWPANRRMLYNRASADPAGKPWSERKRYVWWDEDEGTWTGEDVPDFQPDKRPDYVPPDGAKAQDAIAGDHPFIMQADGRGWLFAPAGLVDGPLPTHYEPHESPFANALYAQRANPARQIFDRPGNRSQPVRRRARSRPVPVRDDDVPPDRASHGRRDEPVRAVPVRAPAGDVLRGQPRAGGRARSRARRLGDDHHRAGGHRGAGARHRAHAPAARAGPAGAPGRPALSLGLARARAGGSANDLFPIVLDPNVHIQEVKAATCDIRPGRAPRGASS